MHLALISWFFERKETKFLNIGIVPWISVLWHVHCRKKLEGERRKRKETLVNILVVYIK